MPIYQLGEWIPQIDSTAFVHETAVIIGQVRLGPHVSVWPFATIRGDNEAIELGEGSNCQESCTLHTDPGFPLTIGARVTIGHHAMLHGCRIGDDCLIGIQAVVLNGAVVGAGSLIGAASLVTEGRQVPERSLVLGSPGKVARLLQDSEIERSRAIAQSYVARASRYRLTMTRIS